MKPPTEEMQKKYSQLQHMENTLQEAQTQILRLETQLQEVASAKISLSSLSETAKGDSILVPITNGMFVKASLQQNDPVYVNIGADTIVNKSRIDAITLLDQQEDQLMQAHERLIKAFTQMEEHAKTMEQELQNLIKIHEEN